MSRKKIKINKNCTESMPSYESVKDRILAGILSSVGSVLLILSGIIIGGELLESYNIVPIYIVLLLGFVVIFSIVNNRMADLLLGFSAAAIIVYMLIVRDSVFTSISINGSACLINEYVEKWNYYFDTMYFFPEYGHEGVSTFCFAATVFIVIILHVASGIFRRKIIFALYPLVLIIANLLVGLAPGLSGMMCMLSGMLFALHVDAESKSKRYGITGYFMTAGMAAVLILLSCTVFGKPADAIVAAHDDVRDFQSDIESRVKLWVKYGDMGTEGMVTNDTPKYSGEEVIQISLKGGFFKTDEGEVYDNRMDNLYLKGYNSSEYYEGRWLYDSEKFEDFCVVAGMENAECSRKILGIVNGSNETKTDDRTLEIAYTGIANNKAYMPYYTYGQEDNEGVHITEDCRFIRDNGINKINVMRDFGLLTFSFSFGKGLEDSAISSISVSMSSNDAFEKKYSQYVRNTYVKVPDNQKTARSIADELTRSYIFADYEKDMYSYVSDEYIYATNDYRAEMANAVAEYLEKNARYTLSPGSNGDEDVIEYFLSKSKRGFCMHFASAGVMILRSMGIPARYVTGYAVFPKDFNHMGDSDIVMASVKDYAAHAWAEVYMEGRGWVPYEMTPAYSDDEEKLPTQWTREDIEKRYGGTGNRENNSGKSDTDSNTGDNNSNVGNTNAGTVSGLLTGKNGVYKIIVACIILFAAVTTGIFVVRHSLGCRDMVSADRMKGDADYNRAVKKINRNIYVHLIKKRGVKRYYKNDSDYYAALRNEFQYINGGRWSAYAEIVRTASYSDMKVTEEEARMCMNILSDIRNIK